MGTGLGREGGAGAAEGPTRPEWKRTSDTSPEFASAALPVMVGVHASTGVNGSHSYTKRLVSGVWRSVCAACGGFFAGKRGLRDHQQIKHQTSYEEATEAVHAARGALVRYARSSEEARLALGALAVSGLAS